MPINNITAGTIEHIIDLGKSREAGLLSSELRVELFDSIDCLDENELAELYALLEFAKAGKLESFSELVCKAKDIGFSLVEEVFEYNKLGSCLSKGWGIYCNKSI